MKELLALRHIAFEDLGSFRGLMEARGFVVRYVDPGLEDMDAMDALAPDLVVALGGPIGVYQDDAYPFVAREVAFIQRRLAAGRPILGICLGAQVIARALGVRVYPGPAVEIGWKPLRLTEAGLASPLAHLDGTLASMMHWHGDTFDLPEGATNLASTDTCTHQAFSVGRNCLAFQCHPELEHARIEQWLVGHACELAQNGLAPGRLRSETALQGPRLQAQAAQCLEQWLDGVAW